MPQEHRKTIWFGAFVLTLALTLAYSNSFWGVFLFDDNGAIIKNQSLRSFWPLGADLHSAAGPLVFSRPLVNLTLTVNYHISGLQPWSYHVVNLFIHIFATLTLFGIIRRTLALPSMANRFGSAATGLALASALLWGLHPLQTESVTYVWQRCESQMGLFFLLTLYLSIRGWQAKNPRPWHLAAVGACLMGALSKEVIIVAPFMVLAYEVVFLEKGIKKALADSPWLYAGLIVSLTPMFYLIPKAYFSRPPGELDPLASPVDVSNWVKIATQAEVITHYLKLTFGPAPLILDYGWPFAKPAQIWPQILLISMLLLGSGAALARRYPIGFLGFWFFGILSVTSNGVIIPDPAFEHRMYLSLAAPVVLAVLLGYVLVLRLASANTDSPARRRRAMIAGISLVGMISLALGGLTWSRNRHYLNQVAFFEEALLQRPHTSRVQANLGAALIREGRFREAIPHLTEAIRINPGCIQAMISLGAAFGATGNLQEAKENLERALELFPGSANALYNYSLILLMEGKIPEAARKLEKAVQIAPWDSDVQAAIALVLVKSGRPGDALNHLALALKYDPGHTKARALLKQINAQKAKIP